MTWKTLIAEMGIQIGAVIFGAISLAGAVALYAYLVSN